MYDGGISTWWWRSEWWSTISKHPYNKIKKVFDILCMMAAFQHGDEEVNDGVP